MKVKSRVGIFKKLDIKKDKVLKIIEKTRFLHVVITKTGKRHYCVYGLKQRNQKRKKNE